MSELVSNLVDDGDIIIVAIEGPTMTVFSATPLLGRILPKTIPSVYSSTSGLEAWVEGEDSSRRNSAPPT